MSGHTRDYLIAEAREILSGERPDRITPLHAAALLLALDDAMLRPRYFVAPDDSRPAPLPAVSRPGLPDPVTGLSHAEDIP